MDILRKTLKYLDYRKILSVYLDLILIKKKEYLDDFNHFLRKYKVYLFQRKIQVKRWKDHFLYNYMDVFQLENPPKKCKCEEKATHYFILFQTDRFKCKSFCHSCIYRHLYSYYERYHLYNIDEEKSFEYNPKAYIPFISWSTDHFDDIKEDLNKNEIERKLK